MKAVIDSDVLIDYLQGVPEAKAEIAKYSQPLYSIIHIWKLCVARKTKRSVKLQMHFSNR